MSTTTASDPLHAGRPTLRHVGALDGIRGLAVIGVLAFHADHITGGFLGVDAFFVLSGFLITALLLVESEGNGRIDLRAFWGRRARRLLPAMFATVAVAALLVRFVLGVDGQSGFGGEAAAALTYVSNWFAVSEQSDYWALFEEPSPLEHLWSLAIEEQFYVVWPLAVAACLAIGRGRRRVLGAVVVVGTLASWAALVHFGGDAAGTARAYYGTDTRAGAILVGALVAVVATGRERVPNRVERGIAVVAAPVALAVGASWFVAGGTDPWLYQWGLPAHGVAVALVIAAVTGPCAGRLGAALAWSPLRAAGRVSYGLYLWHWPVFVVLDGSRTGLDGWPLTALRIAVSLAVTLVSYKLIEQPVRRERVQFRRPVLAGAGGALATAAIVALAVLLPGSSDRVDQPVAAAVSAERDVLAQAVPVTPAAPPTRLLVVGDSGAKALGPSIEAAGGNVGMEVMAIGRDGCGLPRKGEGVSAPNGFYLPDPEGCDDWPERWAAAVEEHDPDVTLLHLAWAGVGARDLGDGTTREPCDETYDDYYLSELQRAVEVLSARGAPVLVTTAPTHGFDRSGDEQTICLNRLYREIARTSADAELVDFAQWTCETGPCLDDEDPRRPDGIHFAGQGAFDAAAWLVAEVEAFVEADGVARVAVVGDSQAFSLAEYAPPVDELGIRVDRVSVLGCGLDTADVVFDGERVGKDKCRNAGELRRADVERLDPDVVVVHTGFWEAYDAITDETTVTFPSDDWFRRREAAIDQGLAQLSEGDHELVVLTTPCFGEGPGAASIGGDQIPDRVDAVNDMLRRAAETHGARIVDYGAYLCPDGVNPIDVEGITVRPDGVHLERAGAALVWRWLAPQLANR